MKEKGKKVFGCGVGANSTSASLRQSIDVLDRVRIGRGSCIIKMLKSDEKAHMSGEPLENVRALGAADLIFW